MACMWLCLQALTTEASALSLNSTQALATFEVGSWCLGNATEAQLLNNTYMPAMPLQSIS